jgi:hypothetical protein
MRTDDSEGIIEGPVMMQVAFTSKISAKSYQVSRCHLRRQFACPPNSVFGFVVRYVDIYFVSFMFVTISVSLVV